MDPTLESNPDETRRAAAAALTADPEAARLLEKHAAYKAGSGDRPTQSEFGKLGFLAKTKQFFLGPQVRETVPPVGSPQSGPSPGNAPPVATVAQTQAPDTRMAPVPIDPNLTRDVAEVLLEGYDGVHKGLVGNAARAITSDAATINRFESKAGFDKRKQALVAKLAPLACQSLGWDVRLSPVWAIGGIFGIHALETSALLIELRRLRLEMNQAGIAKLGQPASHTATIKAAVLPKSEPQTNP